MSEVIVEWQVNQTSTAAEGGDTVETTYGRIDIDVVSVETYALTAEATEHPVEDGVNITDHVRPGLSMISLECTVSNTPITSTLDHTGNVQQQDLSLPSRVKITRGALGLARQRSQTEESEQTQGVSVFKFDEEFDRVREVFDQLQDLKDSGTRIDLIGARFGDLEGYLIINLNFPVDNDNGVNFTMDLRELRTAQTQEVDAPSPQVERARRRSDRGNNPTTEEGDDSDRAADTRSILQSLVGTITN